MALSRTGFVFIMIHLINTISAQEILTQDTAGQENQEMSKRVPLGFNAMRGKKFYDPSEEGVYYKRKPQFFVGVKGKKNLYEPRYFLAQDNKRAPVGFVGMRGKKDLYSAEFYPNPYDYLPQKQGSLIGEIDYTSDPQTQPDFPLLNEILNEYIQRLETVPTDKTNEIQKRAAHMNQFYGVRGKKSIQNKRPYDLTFRGRFIGVRGKKDGSDGDQDRYLQDSKEMQPKRKSQVGFFGMRGKKWDDASVETEDQQSQN